MLAVYHEIESDNIDIVLEEGIKRESRGEKADDNSAARADEILDDLCPAHLKQADVSRDDNIFCYLPYQDGIVDIKDGITKTAQEISANPDESLLKVEIDPLRSYVSDVDLYDQIVEAIEAEDKEAATELANDYWHNLVLLDEYDHEEGFKRPEVMVTDDIPPESISVEVR